MTCETCLHWQDYTDRVHARVSNTRSSFARGVIELRRCKYEPPPTISKQWDAIYTDKDHVCAEYRLARNC